MNLSDHCSCGFPMTVTLDEGGIWRGQGKDKHDPERETMPGLAAVIDSHHLPMLCASCDGTKTFVPDNHFTQGEE